MKLTDIFEAAVPGLTFTYHEDIEGDKNRGWQIDEIKAIIDGKEVGYLKISYIPKERFKTHYPNILTYLRKMKGISVLPYGYDNVDYHDIPPEILKGNLEHAYLAIVRGWDMEEFERLRNLPLDQVIPEYEKFEKIAQNRHGRQFREFKHYHIDKAIDDFVSVKPEFQGKGIGSALERAAHEWMKKKGIQYYLSTLRTKPGEALLTKLKRDYPMTADKTWSAGETRSRYRFAD